MYQGFSAEIFPNPFESDLTLHVHDGGDEISWEIYDVLGRNTMGGSQHLQNHEMQLSLESLPGGPYFICIRSGGQSIVMKCFRQ